MAEDLRTVPRELNRRFARTIADVVELATLRVREELAVSGDLDKAARIPVVEVSLLGVSRTMAGVYIDNGLQLRDRFHETRAAFEEGDIGFTHVREIVTALQGLDDALLARVEPEAILIAQQGLSRSVLRNELDRMVIAVDPDGAAERRKAMKPHRDYRSSRDRRQLHQQRADAQGGGDLCTHHKPACSSRQRTRGQQIDRNGMRPRVVWTEERGSAATESTREDDALRAAYPRAPASRQHCRHRQSGITAPPPGLLPPDGHGGLTEPPPGALTYQPSQALREMIIARDGTCRTPGCSTPASECEIDHIIPFNHADPRSGGWTIEEDLAPICRPDHKRKTLGYWIARMHSDRTITWTTQYGQTYVTRPHGLGR
ncbi:HNH endonuclease signature motif containing protein [Williamsia sp. DF01-3]|uniref:HNH endonuclease signature motif containing protein n=1 Tax=Williamsia sp. DF01-3 TaxID=2934157 RepID=UPI001FF4B546|nr:HNH endonuclease signature motif containing protein [Williamsia sp. DF01-3]MCK0517712.1 HNH endonuclease [Williamsia sp. DF01-3]